MGSWLSAACFLLLLAVAASLSLRGVPLGQRRREEGLLLAAVLVAWLAVAVAAPELLPADAENGTPEGAVAVVAGLVALAVGLVLALRRGAVALLPLAPLLVLAAPWFTARPRVSLLVAVCGLALASAAWVRTRRDYDRAA